MSKASEVRSIASTWTEGTLFSQRYVRDYILSLIPEDPDKLADEAWLLTRQDWARKSGHPEWSGDAYVCGEYLTHPVFYWDRDEFGKARLWLGDKTAVLFTNPTRLQVALIEAAFTQEQHDEAA